VTASHPSIAGRRGFSLPGFTHPVRGLLHGSACVLALALASHFASNPTRNDGLDRLLLAYALSHAFLFATSAAYHSMPWPPRAKARMQRLDHSMIYVKIAGSLGPLAWLVLDVTAARTLILASWTVAGLGIAQKALLPTIHPKASSAVQILQALLFLPVLAAVAEVHPGAPTYALLFAAATYTVGAGVFLLERPRLWPRRFSFHELFHVLVVLGSLSIASAVLELVARLR
jgi:hemolysin III